MKKITEKQAVELLKKHAPSNSVFQKVYQHCKMVQKIALSLAQEIQKNGHLVDLEFIKIASLLHDLGRFQAPPKSEKSLQHGIIGAKILRKLGLPRYALLCERHLGAGITKEEIIKYKLPLPKKDLIPKTIEEKIITYADDLVGDRILTVSEVVQRFKKEIKNPEALKRMVRLHNEIEKLRGGTYFIQ
ncbi:HDIG domain-containing protein [Candidatus Woesearchaeota archaeon]|nr:HDIG domain-containing protein [Candidatus Woesearchaeota archaeon]